MSSRFIAPFFDAEVEAFDFSDKAEAEITDLAGDEAGVADSDLLEVVI